MQRSLSSALSSLVVVFYVIVSLFGAVHGAPILRDSSSNSTASNTVSGPGSGSGCGKNSSWTFDSSNHANITTSDGRSYLVHIPADYTDSTQHPLVLSFHGFSKDGAQQEKASQFSEQGLTINGHGIVAVYPDGAFGPGKSGKKPERAWQGAPYAKEGVDDIQFTQDMIGQLKQNLCIDEQRIYAAGKSNGGGFTNLLACTKETASQIAAFAPVSAALYPGTLATSPQCDPGRNIPIVTFHGLSDNTMPFKGQDADKNGDKSYATPDIDVFRQTWAQRNGCGSTTPQSRFRTAAGKTTVQDWDCTAGQSPSGSSNSTGAAASNSASASGNNTSAANGTTTATSEVKTDAAAETDAEKGDSGTGIVHGFSVSGLGHTWPTTDGGDDGKVASFNATPEDIVPFFERHTLGN